MNIALGLEIRLLVNDQFEKFCYFEAANEKRFFLMLPHQTLNASS
jgi:hypothetical protein